MVKYQEQTIPHMGHSQAPGSKAHAFWGLKIQVLTSDVEFCFVSRQRKRSGQPKWMGEAAEADGASCLEVERCQHRGWWAPQGCTSMIPARRDAGMEDEVGPYSQRERNV